MKKLGTDFMPSFVARGIAWAKLDASIIPLLLGRIWSVFAGPLTPLFIATFTSPAQQGLFYAFGGILAIQGLFELGFNQVIQQYVSHERPFVRISNVRIQGGRREALSNLRVLFRIAIAWYLLLAFVVLAVVGLYGNHFFASRSEAAEGWQMGWWLLVTASCLSVLCQPLILVINGLNFVSFVNKWRTVSTILQTLALWGALAAGLTIKAPGVSAWVGASALLVPFIVFFLPLFFTLGQKAKSKNFWPIFGQLFRLQTKTGLSWITGYFVFQIFNPILFLTTDEARTGYFGMTQAVLASAASFPLAWVQTKLPSIGAALGAGEPLVARSIFREGMTRVLAFSLPALLGAYSLLFLMQHFFFKEQRIMGVAESMLLVAGFVAQNAVLSMASFCRAHKAEPFVIMSWVQATSTVALLWILSERFSLLGAALSFFVSWILAAVWCSIIFRRFWSDSTTPLSGKP